jgi:hypothetical protein
LVGCSDEEDEEHPHFFSNIEWGKVFPPTYQEIRCHMIFDVNMEDFRRNARFL